jgi:hypothetical protein
VYDYILFRGTDIKDIRVVNNVTIPNDPAIMQMHLPPNQMVQSGFQPQGFGGPPMGHLGGPPQMGQFGPYGGLGNMGVSLTGSNMGGPNSVAGVKPKQSELNNVIPQDPQAEHKDQGVLGKNNKQVCTKVQTILIGVTFETGRGKTFSNSDVTFSMLAFFYKS